VLKKLKDAYVENILFEVALLDFHTDFPILEEFIDLMTASALV
jgi:hypothetical protein